MVDQSVRLDNYVNNMPDQTVCRNCAKAKWWHEDDQWKERTCQRFQEKSTSVNVIPYAGRRRR